MRDQKQPAIKNESVTAIKAERSVSTRRGAEAIPVVGIGASVGGLQAFIHLLEAVPKQAGMAFVLIQHLLPDHESMMAQLLTASTHMNVRQIDGDMDIAPDSVYVSAPGQDVSISGNRLLVSDRPAKRPERLPIDIFLMSLAVERAGQAMCVVLSGTGQDGSKGLKAVKHAGGFVIAQDPDEAEADGMPKSAIATGDVDVVLTAALIPAALMNWNNLPARTRRLLKSPEAPETPDWLSRILKILLERTGTDFSVYKPGTLVRRITRRMSLVSTATLQGADYLKILLDSPQECEALAADLLINVTRFFRDQEVFEFLEKNVLAELVANHRADRPLRVWVAGCSSGEEAWSLAMLLREAIDADGRNVRLQLLASDIDPDAIATARAGLYPASIAEDVSPERLARFFTPDERGYRINEDLKAQAVFTVQNLLSDPPFARLDLVSCRNVLIYLGPEAQEKIISHFEFALVSGGILLLGSSETAGNIAARFEIISQPARIFRRLGRSWQSDADNQDLSAETGLARPRFFLDLEPTPDAQLGDVCQRAVAQFYTPASVLTRRDGACLHFVGPVDQFLDVPEGAASLDILPMVPLSNRAALRSAMTEVGPEKTFLQLSSLSTSVTGEISVFQIDVRYVPNETGDLLLITFHKSSEPGLEANSLPGDLRENDTLRLSEILGLREEIAHAGRLLDRALESERKTRRECIQLNEEYQSTNEELLTSKEELQALNEELKVLNSQLQETVDRQRTTSDDLTNVLNSTNVATLFLDHALCIRFFTPATRSVFGVIATDIGRPISDLRSRVRDPLLLEDANAVLHSGDPRECEVATDDGVWFLRRILPYLTGKGEVEGIVVTFVNIMEQHLATETLKTAILQAEQAVIAKNRFLAAASHDLRQPLQTLTFIQSLLARNATEDEVSLLASRMQQAVSAMSGMLDTLLDINQIQAGIVSYQLEDIPVSDIITNLFNEFSYHAHAKSLELSMARSKAIIRTDRRLFEQMIRNLLSNAIRYTDAGRILIGCRRRSGRLRIEIWDTGIGISESDLPRVFGEYHTVGAPKRDTTGGIGLGLSIVQRLADLLGHKIYVRSWPDRGSMFSVEVDLAKTVSETAAKKIAPPAPVPQKSSLITGRILVTEDEPDLRQMLELLLKKTGHEVLTTATLEEAVGMALEPGKYPDLLIADYNLPNERSGVELARLLRAQNNAALPVIILTGDISTATRSLIAGDGLAQITKPVSGEEMENQTQALLREPAPSPSNPGVSSLPSSGKTHVVIVDDDLNFCETLTLLLKGEGITTACFASGEAFLDQLSSFVSPEEPVCVLIDAYLGQVSGFDLLAALREASSSAAAIMITGRGDVHMAVRAMKAGALDFIEKPVEISSLRESIERALSAARNVMGHQEHKSKATRRFETLTAREKEILDLILTGQPNKNIAADLGISQRTVEAHRASIMTKARCKSLPALVRLAVLAFSSPFRSEGSEITAREASRSSGP